ncbi:MAG TPA: efflux RND transporter periplasmic adaptor subunit [Kofleriaceae bacterium]|jgi:Cu(I)/Ag(I) efflux system membrane fusion protein|nr:efflux RND transporter periplasmic adaptor subunit [Kofleriaceae bacterium]
MKRHWKTIAVVAVIAIAVVVVRGPLIAWFTGGSVGGGTSPAAHVVAGGFSIDTSIEPDPPRESGNVAHVSVRDAQGKPVTGAKVRLDYEMPAMGTMQAMHGGADARDEGDGRYAIAFDLPMNGTWTIAIRVDAVTARYTLRIGASGLTAVGGEGAGNGSDVDYYTCSMHPQVHSATPGTCPICGMTLTPVTREQEQVGVIHIADERRAQLGIRTTKVMLAPIDQQIVAKGRLAVDETRLHEITLKIGGYVSDLHVNATGQTVAKGERLFTLYSPELYAAEQEYLIARSNHDVGHGDALVHAAETKLRLWGLSDDQLHKLADKGEPIERVPFTSPASGVVIEKNVIDGGAVVAGQRLFKIADLDEVWVEADVYEPDLAKIAKGQAAKIALDYLPGETFAGRVAFVYPYLDPASRTGRVRIALPNQHAELKPDMFATVTFDLPLGPRLVVPASAVVYTGPRRLVFLDLGGGALRPQEVTIGARTGDQVEITSGLKAGDVVVSSGNFLVAAESRIRSTSTYWEGSDAQ